MATVIRNPIVIQCLRQYGITPAEARKLDELRSIEDMKDWASLTEYLADYRPDVRSSSETAK